MENPTVSLRNHQPNELLLATLRRYIMARLLGVGSFCHETKGPGLSGPCDGGYELELLIDTHGHLTVEYFRTITVNYLFVFIYLSLI